MTKNEEAHETWKTCGLLSENDPFILALKDPGMWLKAIGFIGAAYAVLLIVRAVVC